MIFANPLLNASAAEQSLQGLKTFVTQTLGGNFSVTIEPSYLSFYNDFLRNNEVVRIKIWELISLDIKFNISSPLVYRLPWLPAWSLRITSLLLHLVLL